MIKQIVLMGYHKLLHESNLTVSGSCKASITSYNQFNQRRLVNGRTGQPYRLTRQCDCACTTNLINSLINKVQHSTIAREGNATELVIGLSV